MDALLAVFKEIALYRMLPVVLVGVVLVLAYPTQRSLFRASHGIVREISERRNWKALPYGLACRVTSWRGSTAAAAG